MNLSVIIPCYNEADTIVQVVQTVHEVIGEEGEIIIVGNGGTKDGLRAVKAGQYHQIISVTPYYANQVFDAIEAYTSGKTLASYIRVDDIVIDQNNVDEHMALGF